MDKLSEISHGAKVVLGASIAFLIVSFFNWFEAGGAAGDVAEAIGVDAGASMWHGVGWLAGLLAIALIAWQAIRLANIKFEVGVTPSMVTAALAVLLAIFAIIRFIDKPGGSLVDRTFWAWLGLILAVVVVAGAWANMKAAGESLTDVRDRVASMASSQEQATAAAGEATAAASQATTAAVVAEVAAVEAVVADEVAVAAAEDAIVAADVATEAAVDAVVADTVAEVAADDAVEAAEDAEEAAGGDDEPRSA